jgi:hypothetical protein
MPLPLWAYPTTGSRSSTTTNPIEHPNALRTRPP